MPQPEASCSSEAVPPTLLTSFPTGPFPVALSPNIPSVTIRSCSWPITLPRCPSSPVQSPNQDHIDHLHNAVFHYEQLILEHSIVEVVNVVLVGALYRA